MEFDKDFKQACADYVKAQKAMGKAIRQATNPHFKTKYVDLQGVLDACGDAFNDNNFSIQQPHGRDVYGDFVRTILIHTTGQRFESKLYLVLEKKTMQGLGSAITYARRYALMGMAGLAPEDDDANEASTKQVNTKPPKKDKQEGGF